MDDDVLIIEQDMPPAKMRLQLLALICSTFSPKTVGDAVTMLKVFEHAVWHDYDDATDTPPSNVSHLHIVKDEDE